MVLHVAVVVVNRHGEQQGHGGGSCGSGKLDGAQPPHDVQALPTAVAQRASELNVKELEKDLLYGSS